MSSDLYEAHERRYEPDTMQYARVGASGLKLPRVSLGLWHNFGDPGTFDNMTAMCRTAFDHGITHFDLANNYGPKYGAAEANFGRILATDFARYRDELIISTKAGFDMWPGPYGIGGSRKYLISSLDQSLERLGLDYVDIFYHHCPDPDTPLEETVGALEQIVRSGKALYVGLSNYDGERMAQAAALLDDLHVPYIINQNRCNIFDRTVERNGLLGASLDAGKGVICYSPLAQGLLTDRYVNGIPSDSRIGADGRFLHREDLTPDVLAAIRSLNAIAAARGETLADMALEWVLRAPAVTSVVVGASRPGQIEDSVRAATAAAPFSAEELAAIDAASAGIQR